MNQAAPPPLALVGSGEFLPAMEAVDRELLAGRPARVVFLPTAAAQDGAEQVDYWIRLGTAHYRRLGAQPVALRVLDRGDADDPALAEQVAGAGLVYLSGGNPGYLADTLRDSAVWAAIMSAWAGGAALAGCSAGACALTAAAEDMEAHEIRPGLGVVPDLVVLPHFDRIEGWLPGVVECRAASLEPGQTLVGIDEDTALVGRPGGWTVRGRGRVWVLGDRGERRAYRDGSRLDVGTPVTPA